MDKMTLALTENIVPNLILLYSHILEKRNLSSLRVSTIQF